MTATILLVSGFLASAQNAREITIKAPQATLTLEVADTYQAREYGLMKRTVVPAKTGMIFVFERDGPQRFWMKNTLVPLDMLFVRADGTVSSIAANVPASTMQTPQDRVAVREGHGKYVIELRAGESERVGLHSGAKLDLPKLEPRD